MSDAQQVTAWAGELGRIPTKREIKQQFHWGTDRALRARREAASSLPHLPEGQPAKPTHRQGVTFTATGDTATVEAPQSRIRTLDQLLEAAEVDPSVWEVERWTANKWEVGGRGPDGSVIVEPLYQVKAWLSRLAPSGLEARIEAVRDAAIESMTAAGPQTNHAVQKRTTASDGLLLEVSAPDLHIGKLAWADETGESYDLQLAEEAFKTAVVDALDKAKFFPIAKCLFVVGNDLLHVDNAENTTTRGTRQDVDTRWQKSFRRALQLMTWGIDELRAIAPVDVMTVPGNHASVLEHVIGEALAARYYADESVSVDTSPRHRKPYQWGRVLLGFAHGHNERHTDLPELMAHEWPELWGDTSVREWHVGHLHQRNKRQRVLAFSELQERHGVAVRIIPSLCAADAWHASKGYLGNLRACEAFLWDRERGLEVQVTGHPH